MVPRPYRSPGASERISSKSEHSIAVKSQGESPNILTFICVCRRCGVVGSRDSRRCRCDFLTLCRAIAATASSEETETVECATSR